MMSLRALIKKASDADLLRELIGFAAQRLVELEVGERCCRLVGRRTSLMPIFHSDRNPGKASDAEDIAPGLAGAVKGGAMVGSGQDVATELKEIIGLAATCCREVQRPVARTRLGWQLYGSGPPTDGGVILNRQRRPEQVKDGADRPLGLAQRQRKDGIQHRRRRDR